MSDNEPGDHMDHHRENFPLGCGHLTEETPCGDFVCVWGGVGWKVTCFKSSCLNTVLLLGQESRQGKSYTGRGEEKERSRTWVSEPVSACL